MSALVFLGWLVAAALAAAAAVWLLKGRWFK